MLLAGGSENPFDFFAKSPGRDLDGIQYRHAVPAAAEPAHRRRDAAKGTTEITAKGKHVIVIGGGDTGSDCIGTSFRQGAKSVTQLEIMPKPPEKEVKALSWPHWPLKLRISSSQAEGAKTEFSISTTGFNGKDGKVTGCIYTRVDNKLQPVPGIEGELPADLVLFAMGFDGPIEDDVDRGARARGRPARPLQGRQRQREDYRVAGAGKKLFAAGDIRRGQSLVVWAIREGRQAAARDRQVPDGARRRCRGDLLSSSYLSMLDPRIQRAATATLTILAPHSRVAGCSDEPEHDTLALARAAAGGGGAGLDGGGGGLGFLGRGDGGGGRRRRVGAGPGEVVGAAAARAPGARP